MSEQRTLVVTGAASGIGATTARMAEEQGYRVIGVDIHDADVVADLSTEEGRKTAADKCAEVADGRIDAVAACAGISAPVAKTASVNYFGVVGFLEALRPTLAKSETPRAAVVSSMGSLNVGDPDLVEAMLAGDEPRALEIAAGIEAKGPEIGFSIYPASKRALSRWVRRASISDEWAGAHIPLNAVAPGTVITPITEQMRATKDGLAGLDATVPMPLNYHQPPETIASVLLFLVSVANSHMAGQTIYCDGGADATLRGDDIWSWND
jgi:NAD(P)-dependent dehydrogenase (short-subunit alcohol dehydrogenase family)